MTPDYSDNAIEDDALLARLNTCERPARHWAGEAKALHTTARSWREMPTVAKPGEAEEFAAMAEEKAGAYSRLERDHLASLNAVFLAVSRVGDIWEVNDSLYRVVTAGNPCVRLGCTLPADEPDADDEWSDRDEQAEKMALYGQMVRVGQP